MAHLYFIFKLRGISMFKKLTAALLAIIMLVGFCQTGIEVLAAQKSELDFQQVSDDEPMPIFSEDRNTITLIEKTTQNSKAKGNK